ncbi:MAG TPA: hypothetical protein VNA69_14005 [Thermoanaerobaculia bacterium]|nr:hypothetical protein [Thermoanaerobaculia bacterium]
MPLFALLLVLAAVPSQAALQYDYVVKSVSEENSDLSARATVDGTRSRIEFLAGNTYPPGTYVITSDGSRLIFVDPANKWYTEFNAGGAVSAVGASNITVDNIEHKVHKLADSQLVAGIATEHYQIVLDYDVTVLMRSIPLKAHVHTVIDNWVTDRFGDLAQPVMTNSVRTGNAKIDSLLDFETENKIKGFPMKQVATTRTTFENRATQSQLKVNPTRTVRREMRVTAIRETEASPAMFVVPPGFIRATTPEMPRTASQVLTFEPGSK